MTQSRRRVTPSRSWTRWQLAVSVVIGLALLSLLVGNVHYLVVRGTNLNALISALVLTLFLAMVCRGYWTGLFSGPTGLRCRTLTKTRDFAWEEIAGFELRPHK